MGQPSEHPAIGSTATAATFVGVDVGGTKISIATMRDGVLAEPALLPTECSSQESLIGQLSGGIKDAIQSSGGQVAAVGVGIPSVIEFATGRVRSSVNIPLREVPLRDVLQERLGGLAVFVDNDATCAALAEAHDEHGHLDTKDLVMFTVGTGVGGGVIINGCTYRGATGAAGELGHMIIGMDLEHAIAESDGFPKPGSLEALASGHALDELARASGAQYPNSALGRMLAGEGDVAGPDAVRAAQEGDPQARATLSLLAQRLGVGIANAINIFDPEVVAIGGGVSAAHELLLDVARESALRFVVPGAGTATEIRLARSGPKAGVRGAALLAAQELEHARAGREQ
jgi:glucokinase